MPPRWPLPHATMSHCIGQGSSTTGDGAIPTSLSQSSVAHLIWNWPDVERWGEGDGPAAEERLES
jgi:hypothetical protein